MFFDTHGGNIGARLKMHFEAVIVRVWRYALGGQDHANLEGIMQ